jgi:drug/metabolite transporter (DMT)-like permease
MTISHFSRGVFGGDNVMRRAMTWALVFAALWALLDVLLEAELHTPFNLLQIVWCRYAIHLCICLLLWGWSRPTALWRTSRPAYQIFRSILMIIMPGAFTLAIHLGVTAEFVGSVFWISPVLIVGLASFFLKEKPPLAVVVVGIAGYFAALVIVGHPRPPSWTALGLALTVAGSFSIYVVMTRLLRDEAVEANMFYTAICPFIALTPILPGIWIAPPMHDDVVLVAIGSAGFVGLLALDNACRIAPVWSSANSLFAQALFVAVLVSGVPAVHQNSHALLGMVALAVMIGFQWVRADRFAMLIKSEPTRT